MASFGAKQPAERLVLSNAIRSGILGLTKTLSNELAEYGILVNAVCPGWTRTRRVEELAKSMVGESEEKYRSMIDEWASKIPLKSLANPGEIANLVVFLASEKASYITGTVIQVDGGFIKSLLKKGMVKYKGIVSILSFNKSSFRPTSTSTPHRYFYFKITLMTSNPIKMRIGWSTRAL